MAGKICGTGSYVPSHYLHNDDVAKLVDTNDAWIRERTGIVQRHIKQEETTVSMAAEAAKRALENAGAAPEEVDLLIVSTISSNVILPCTACMVQEAIGATNAMCFDVNAACTGFLVAYNTAQAYFQSGLARCALLIGAEGLSDLVDWEDRSTCILFGDGAGAAVLRVQEDTPFSAVMHSDGSRGSALTCTHLYKKMTENAEAVIEAPYMQMNGQEVFRFAVKQVPEVIQELLDKEQLTTEDIDWFILHQANRRIIEAVAKRLHTDMDRFPVNVDAYGNTSSASIPILLDELNHKGLLKPGQKIILAGFGAGLSWGATLMEW